MAKYACGNCGELGHNRRTCPGQAPAAPLTASEQEVVGTPTPWADPNSNPCADIVTLVADYDRPVPVPKNGHMPIPMWRGPNGQQYCYAYESHGEWVLWPCDKV